ncbi:MAG: ATP-binding protein [Gemmatimonadales bacterium]|nr:ATP-binding protein [Gemmatimonadales bacterium]
MPVEEPRILLIGRTPAADVPAALARSGRVAAVPDLAQAGEVAGPIDCVVHAGPPEGGRALLDLAGRFSPVPPVFVVAALPGPVEDDLIRAGVEAGVDPARLERLAPLVERALQRPAPDAATLAAKLALAEERLGNLVKRVSGIAYEVDPVSGEFTWVGPQTEQILGYPAADWLAPGFWNRRCHQADQAAADAAWRREVAAGRDYTLEYRMIAADGRTVWFQDWGTIERRAGEPPRVAGLMVDVSRLKELEETSHLLSQLTARHTGEEFFRTLVLALTKALGVRFALVGEVRGRDRDRITTVALAVDGELAESVTYPIAGTPCGVVALGTSHFVPTGAQSQYPGCVAIQRLGADSYFGLPLFGSADVPIGVLVVLDDTPFERTEAIETVLSLSAARAGAELERRRNEEQRGMLQAQLVQAQKMEAIGTLAGGIAHDFNNILMGILGNAEMAKDELETWNPVHAYLAEILRATHRARDVVQRILTFSRKREPERRATSLAQIIGDATILLRASLPATIELTLELANDAPPIDADPGQIHQVVMNLVTNAAQAIGTGSGTITIREAIVDVDPELARTHVHLAERRYLRLSVYDTGRGMDRDTLGRIFEPFFTTKAPGEGTGLGLAVVHGIVEEHDGVIVVDSDLGHGTVFHVYLPAIDRVAPAPPGPSSAIPLGRGQHILLVDDEPAIVRVGRQMLERLGYRVTAVNSARAALAAFSAAPGSFDLVLSDLTMPEQTGLDLCQRLRLIHPSVGFVLASGHPDVLDAPCPPGVDAILSKPFATARLAHVLDRILRPPVPS